MSIWSDLGGQSFDVGQIIHFHHKKGNFPRKTKSNKSTWANVLDTGNSYTPSLIWLKFGIWKYFGVLVSDISQILL